MTVETPEKVEHKDGIYADIPSQVYHSWELMSQSSLKIIRDKTPAHLRYQLDNPKPSTDAMRLGEAMHTCVLQPDLFNTLYIIEPTVTSTRATKQYKEAVTQLKSDNPDCEILKMDDYHTCVNIRDAVHKHSRAKRLIEGDAERSLIWTDRETEILCKGRIDLISNRGPYIVDLKSTKDASEAEFTKSIYNYGYYMQAAHYIEGCQELGIEVKHFIIIAIEKTPPYAIAVYDISDDALMAGYDDLLPLKHRYAECVKSGIWESYPEKAIPITLPPWAFYQIDERTKTKNERG